MRSHGRVVVALVLSFWSCALLLTPVFSSPVNEEYHDKDCMLDHDGSNAVLEECQEKGYRFVKEYMKVLSRGELKKFGTCENFHPFGMCIRDLWKRCHTVRQVTYPHWKPIVDLMTNACNKTKAIYKYEYHHELQCLESEMSGVLVHRCDGKYDFNVAQKTRDKCVFLKEAIQCKTALVNTSCGTVVGEVAYLLSKINAKKLIQKSRCYITMSEPYNGFHYDDNCPRDFKDDMGDCEETHIKPHTVEFDPHNDLIISGSKRELREACSGWRSYRTCLRPIKDECKVGVDKVLEEEGRLRTYLLKMEYICKEEKEVYLDKVTCLQEILTNKSLGTCTHLWDKLKPFLDMVSSYQYYCEPHNKNTQGMQQVLESLRMCYERVFSRQCGMDLGSIMSELIRRAFSDPFYLRLDYKPDCSFHKDSSSKKRSKPNHSSSPDHYDLQRDSMIGDTGGGTVSASDEITNNRRHKNPHTSYNPGNHHRKTHQRSSSSSSVRDLDFGGSGKISRDIPFNEDIFLPNNKLYPQQTKTNYNRDFAIDAQKSSGVNSMQVHYFSTVLFFCYTIMLARHFFWIDMR